MNHYKEKLSAYLHHELPKETRQIIAEHLLQCESCRKEHDEIKLGVALASKLESFDAPNAVWNEIRNTLDGKPAPTFSLIQTASFFNRRGVFALSASALIVAGVLTLLTFNLFFPEPDDSAKITPSLIPAERKINSSETDSNENLSNNLPANSNPENTNLPSSDNNSNQPNANSSPITIAGWQVETIAGTPFKPVLAVGETLETDANSRAKITVADIGNVEVAPNSRVKLVRSEKTERRLSLEQGKLQAQIVAPPRLFIVDTPSAVAVDWGCAYTLEVDKAGNSKLQVTSGYVALERDGRESIVPAGAMAVTKKGKGIGTPYSETASSEFRAALDKFDFADGGKESLNFMLENCRSYDTVTLWNLLSRVPKNERGRVFDVIVSFIKLPDGITREGILNLDQKMLERLRWELETVWFE
jgi:ferric-dicitrate binding protein FerR (iron transport regulator)